jgi:hypothetical protein
LSPSSEAVANVSDRLTAIGHGQLTSEALWQYRYADPVTTAS